VKHKDAVRYVNKGERIDRFLGIWPRTSMGNLSCNVRLKGLSWTGPISSGMCRSPAVREAIREPRDGGQSVAISCCQRGRNDPLLLERKDGMGLAPVIEPGGKTSGRTAGLSRFCARRGKMPNAAPSLGGGPSTPSICGTLAR
ncbi:MAG: hypothetical protein WA159_22865, partial [Variovorax sp.]